MRSHLIFITWKAVHLPAMDIFTRPLPIYLDVPNQVHSKINTRAYNANITYLHLPKLRSCVAEYSSGNRNSEYSMSMTGCHVPEGAQSNDLFLGSTQYNNGYICDRKQINHSLHTNVSKCIYF